MPLFGRILSFTAIGTSSMMLCVYDKVFYNKKNNRFISILIFDTVHCFLPHIALAINLLIL
jgi:hypothetical protein